MVSVDETVSSNNLRMDRSRQYKGAVKVGLRERLRIFGTLHYNNFDTPALVPPKNNLGFHSQIVRLRKKVTKPTLHYTGSQFNHTVLKNIGYSHY
jgi:hypothetical protein